MKVQVTEKSIEYQDSNGKRLWDDERRGKKGVKQIVMVQFKPMRGSGSFSIPESEISFQVDVGDVLSLQISAKSARAGTRAGMVPSLMTQRG